MFRARQIITEVWRQSLPQAQTVGDHRHVRSWAPTLQSAGWQGWQATWGRMETEDWDLLMAHGSWERVFGLSISNWLTYLKFSYSAFLKEIVSSPLPCNCHVGMTENQKSAKILPNQHRLYFYVSLNSSLTTYQFISLSLWDHATLHVCGLWSGTIQHFK